MATTLCAPLPAFDAVPAPAPLAPFILLGTAAADVARGLDPGAAGAVCEPEPSLLIRPRVHALDRLGEAAAAFLIVAGGLVAVGLATLA